jgi:acetyl/propionyl-CoA carboxylase alpha subunit
LIANRGEITRRVIRSAKALGIPTVVVFTEPDALSLHVKDGDEAVCLGSSPKEYTNAQKLLEVAKTTKYAYEDWLCRSQGQNSH